MGSKQSQEFCQVECEDGFSESLGDLLNVSASTHSDLDPYLTQIGVGTGVSGRLKYRGIKTVALLKDDFHRAGDYHEERVREFDSWLKGIGIGSCDSNRITQDLAAHHPEGVFKRQQADLQRRKDKLRQEEEELKQRAAKLQEERKRLANQEDFQYQHAIKERQFQIQHARHKQDAARARVLEPQRAAKAKADKAAAEKAKADKAAAEKAKANKAAAEKAKADKAAAEKAKANKAAAEKAKADKAAGFRRTASHAMAEDWNRTHDGVGRVTPADARRALNLNNNDYDRALQALDDWLLEGLAHSEKIRVVHENKAVDLVVMDGETVGGLRKTLHGIFGIMLKRLEIRKDDRLFFDDKATLVASGIGEGAVLNVTVSAPKVVQKKAPATPAEALENEETEVERLKLLLDGQVSIVTEHWKETPPSDEAMSKLEWDCKGVDELLTQVLLRLDKIETGSELRARRKECVKKIEALQDGGVICVKEAINAFRQL